MSRKVAREHVFRILYEIPFHNEDVALLTGQYLQDFADEAVEEKDLDFIKEETQGVQAHLEEIDETIGSALKGWKVNRLSKVDLSILRLAVYEILYVEELPISVSINEAVELAKKYSQDAAPAFINGILGAIAPKGIEGHGEL